jgi:hypothetical protein
MGLSVQELAMLRRIISLAERMIAASPKPKRGRPASVKATKRVRRTGKALVQFRRMLKAERKRGISVADLASKYSISTAYVYTL